MKLAADAVYADATLSAVENLPDETLVLLAMTLRDKFGLLSAMPAAPASGPEHARIEEKPEAPAPSRYMSGARS